MYPIITQLERAAGFGPQDEPEAKLAKLEELLGRGTEQLDEAVPLLAALLGIPADDSPPLSLTPQRQKQRTLEVLLEQLEGLARDRPVLEVYEDVHWIDPSTLELLDLLVERVRALPVLVVLTFRPEFTPPWTGQSHATALPLNRLGRREGAAMVERVIAGKTLPAQVLEQILARTDGVPLFVEELTNMVIESGLLSDAGDHYELSGPLPPLAIPTTLHDSLMARLDRLAPVKEVAQISAVIGREFSHDLVAAISPLPPDQLNLALEQLVSSGLIFRRGIPPEASYSFTARPGPGCGIPVAAQVAPPDPSRSDRDGAGGQVLGGRHGNTGGRRSSLDSGRSGRTRSTVLVAGRQARSRALGGSGSRRSFDQGSGGAFTAAGGRRARRGGA